MFKTVRGAVKINYWWIPYVENFEGSCKHKLLVDSLCLNCERGC
jgi:hypothetical protein